MTGLVIGESRPQTLLDDVPYDTWVSPDGACVAQFHRRGDRYLLRFPHQADFALEPISEAAGYHVTAWPAPGCPERVVRNLYRNAILPILGNHSGGLFLHGSAVSIVNEAGNEGGAIAFLGLSRSGKTTLAGAFAKQGHPFLTEDVIDLRLRDGTYWLEPKSSTLRLFHDSAHHLLGSDLKMPEIDEKHDVDGGSTLPFADEAVPLRMLFVLGTDQGAPLSLRRYSPPEALAALLPHAFILDVEDKSRLRAHFSRMADLTEEVACYALDYTRDYAELASVLNAVLTTLRPD